MPSATRPHRPESSEGDAMHNGKAGKAAREAEQKRVSNSIDRQLAEEQKEKNRRGNSELSLLLLGPSGAGKSTFVRQLRLAHDIDGLNAERAAFRLVIILNIISTVNKLLEAIEADISNSSQKANGESSSESEALEQRKLRLAPLLGLEGPIRESLGAVSGSASSQSLARQADMPIEGELEYGDAAAAPLAGGGAASSAPTSRPSSPAGSKRPPVRQRTESSESQTTLLPPRFSERFGGLSFSGRRASSKATNERRGSVDVSKSWTADGQFVADADDPVHLLIALQDEVQKLWDDALSRKLINKDIAMSEDGAGLEISESARYFMEKLATVASPTYLPSDQDILNIRVRTIGIETHHLQITPQQAYRISDPAGARGVKHAWAPYFDSAAAIIFVLAVSDYTVCLPGQPQTNRLRDALDLFENVASNPILKNVVLIVFMNKVDLLRRRLRSGNAPFDRYFPDYKGSARSGEVLAYVQTEVELRHPKSRKRPLYVFETQANDPSIRMIVAAVNDILMRATLAASGLV